MSSKQAILDLVSNILVPFKPSVPQKPSFLTTPKQSLVLHSSKSDLFEENNALTLTKQNSNSESFLRFIEQKTAEKPASSSLLINSSQHSEQKPPSHNKKKYSKTFLVPDQSLTPLAQKQLSSKSFKSILPFRDRTPTVLPPLIREVDEDEDKHNNTSSAK